MNSDNISVFNAHTGAVFQIKRFYFVSVDEFKKFCSSEFNIPINRLFFLSSFGILVRNSSFEEIDDIFVYDKELFSTDENDQLIKKYVYSQRQQSYDSLIQPLRSPLLDISLESVAISRNSKQLISLLTTNLGWVAAIESDCSLAVNKMSEFDSQIEIILRSITVASQYIDSYCLNIKKTFDESVEFVDQLQKNSLNLKWNEDFQNLKTLKMIDSTPLSDLLNSTELSKTANDSLTINEDLNKEFQEFIPIIEKSKAERKQIKQEVDSLSKEMLSFVHSSNYNDIYNGLNKFSEKVRNDTKNLLNKSSNSIDDLDVDIILETFQLHKTQFVEKIYEISMSIYSSSLKYKDFFTNLQFSAYHFLRKLSAAQLGMVSLKESLKSMSPKIEQVQNLESALAHTIDLPLLYGLYIIENMRRGQWLTNIKTVTVKTNEKFAHLREREIKTRNQWVKNYGIILKLLNHDISSFNNRNIISFEIVKNEDPSKQQDKIFTYEDCVSYIQQLEQQKFINKEIVDILAKSLKESLFKKPNFTLELESKQIDSEAIKGYKSRIKKLENLLHQEQFKNFSQWPSNIGSTQLARPSGLIQSAKGRKSSYDNNSFLMSLSRSPSPSPVPENLQKLESQIKELKEKLSSQAKSAIDLKEELKSYKQALSSKEFSNQSTSQKNKELLNLKQVEINNLTRKLASEEICSLKFQAEISTKDDLINTLELKLKEQQNEISNMKASHSYEISSIKEGFSSKDKEFEYLKKSFEKDLKILTDEITTLKITHVAELESFKIDSLAKESELKALQESHNDEVRILNDTNQNELKLKDEEIEILKSEYEEQIRSLSSSDDSPYNKEQIDRFENDLALFQDEITSLKEQLLFKNQELKEKAFDIEESNKTLKELETSSTTKHLQLESTINDLKQEKHHNDIKLKSITEDFDRLKLMKNDLLENMTNREDEFTKEKIVYQEEIELLKTKVEELENLESVNDDTAEMISKYKQLNLQLLIIINSLVIKSRDLTDILVTFYDIFLTSLKSLGLLAVINENKNNNTDIIRVKGLRKNNKLGTSSANINASSVVELNNGFKPILKDDIVSKSLIWNDQTLNQDTNLQIQQLTQLDDSDADEQSKNEQFLNDLNDLIIDNYNLITFEKKYLTFVKFITNLNSIYLSCVSKRFNEVENLAKKELKENKKLKLDNDRGKITIKDFQVNDLVLFLPTKMTMDGNDKDNDKLVINQWAAFNDMGDCKFLMKNDNNKQISPNKQWFIGRILNIEKVNNKEFLLSTEEVL